MLGFTADVDFYPCKVQKIIRSLGVNIIHSLFHTVWILSFKCRLSHDEGKLGPSESNDEDRRQGDHKRRGKGNTVLFVL